MRLAKANKTTYDNYPHLEKGSAMIVCVCHNINDRRIRTAIENGAETMEQLSEVLGVGTCCGKCTSTAQLLLQQHTYTPQSPIHFIPQHTKIAS